MMEVVTGFREIISGHHHYAEAWKARTGGKVVGYLCTYVPEEILYAAGALPVRIFGSHLPEDASGRYSSALWCPHSRDCLAQGLAGAYSYLDGICLGHTCAHTSQTFYSWQWHLNPAFSHFLCVPGHVRSPSALKFFHREVEEFKGAVEKWLGRRISADDLEHAISVYNTNRRLMHQVYGLMEQDSPPLQGSQAMEVVLASFLMDKKEHSQLVEGLLREVSPLVAPQAEPPPRVMLLGSENDDVALVRFIESLGAQVVVDEQCVGTRYFWNLVVPDADPVRAIAARYLDRPPCPQKDIAQRERLSHLSGLAQRYRVQGAIFVLEKFCDMHEFEIPVVQRRLLDLGIPTLILEVDLTTPAGQFRTRIEAFLEMLRLRGEEA